MPEDTTRCPFCAEFISVKAIKCKHCGSMLDKKPPDPNATVDMGPADLRLANEPTAADRVLSNRYRIVREVGRGGMGVVYLAHDQELDMDVAIKLLPFALAKDSRSLELLRSEAKVSMSLSHPNIVRLHTLDTSGHYKFLVMEYVDGPNLRYVINQKEKIALERAMPLIRAICHGVSYAHSRRVLHRDLKPANIMLTSKREVKIADFGIAQQMRESMSLLSQKIVAGTPSYMAPEHLMGEHLTVRSEVYSLAAVVYEIISGHPPFYKGDIPAQVRFKKVSPIKGMPKSVNLVLLRALSKDPEKRQHSVGDFYKTLQNAMMMIQPTEAIEARKPAPPKKRKAEKPAPKPAPQAVQKPPPPKKDPTAMKPGRGLRKDLRDPETQSKKDRKKKEREQKPVESKPAGKKPVMPKPPPPPPRIIKSEPLDRQPERPVYTPKKKVRLVSTPSKKGRPDSTPSKKEQAPAFSPPKKIISAWSDDDYSPKAPRHVGHVRMTEDEPGWYKPAKIAGVVMAYFWIAVLGDAVGYEICPEIAKIFSGAKSAAVPSWFRDFTGILIGFGFTGIAASFLVARLTALTKLSWAIIAVIIIGTALTCFAVIAIAGSIIT